MCDDFNEVYVSNDGEDDLICGKEDYPCQSLWFCKNRIESINYYYSDIGDNIVELNIYIIGTINNKYEYCCSIDIDNVIKISSNTTDISERSEILATHTYINIYSGSNLKISYLIFHLPQSLSNNLIWIDYENSYLEILRVNFKSEGLLCTTDYSLIRCHEGNIIINNCEFENITLINNNGSIINYYCHEYLNNISISNTNFSRCNTENGNGGIIYLKIDKDEKYNPTYSYSLSDLNINNCMSENGKGKAIYIDNTNNYLNLHIKNITLIYDDNISKGILYLEMSSIEEQFSINNYEDFKNIFYDFCNSTTINNSSFIINDIINDKEYPISYFICDYNKPIFVSNDGKDNNQCGSVEFPCLTISYSYNLLNNKDNISERHIMIIGEINNKYILENESILNNITLTNSDISETRKRSEILITSSKFWTLDVGVFSTSENFDLTFSYLNIELPLNFTAKCLIEHLSCGSLVIVDVRVSSEKSISTISNSLIFSEIGNVKVYNSQFENICLIGHNGSVINCCVLSEKMLIIESFCCLFIVSKCIILLSKV
jgi:hypothetical protein